MRIARNLLRHELIGLQCEITMASNKAQTGLAGKIIDETMKTVTLKTAGGHKKIPKKGTVFRVQLDGKKIDIDGNYLLARPEDRIKKKFRKW